MTLRARWGSLPRSARWLAWLGAALAGYFLVVEPALDVSGRVSARAAALEARLVADDRAATARRQQADLVDRGRRLFGDVAEPGPLSDRSEELNRLITKVLGDHAVAATRTTRMGSISADGPLSRAWGSGARFERVTVDLDFECSPEQATAVLLDLEKSPEVAGVSSVTIRRTDARGGGRLVRVGLTVEALTVARREVSP